MERKMGEIFEHNGEWYQCVESEQDACTDCAFNPINGIGYNCSGSCTYKHVIFKKLEKVGEPFSYEHFGLVQKYELKRYGYSTKDKRVCFVDGYDVFIKIKQNKEDMEETKLNIKPFSLEAAKAGKPVCTRDGRSARIVCFDRKANTPIVALIECDNRGEILQCVHNDGRCVHFDTSDNDLMMFSEKKEGWVNVYKRENEYICENECNVSTGIVVYKSEGEAKRNIDKNGIYVNTIKITWEE